MKEAEDDILWDAMTYSILFDDEDDWEDMPCGQA